MKQYTVVELFTGYFSGNIKSRKLTEQLNKYAAQGWMLRTTIRETTRPFLFSRETHLLIFERDAVPAGTTNTPTPAPTPAPAPPTPDNKSATRVLTQADIDRL